jgi:hypothetical protein
MNKIRKVPNVITEEYFLQLDKKYDIEITNDWNTIYFSYIEQGIKFYVFFYKDIQYVGLFEAGSKDLPELILDLVTFIDFLESLNLPIKQIKE